MNAIPTLLIAAGLASLVPAAAPPRLDPRLIPGDAHDLVLLHPSGPYRLRLHVQVNGRDFGEGWRGRVTALMAHLDADGDGKLSEAEACAAPSRAQWAQLLRGRGYVEPDAAPSLLDLAGGGRVVRAAQLVAYYEGSAAGPLQVLRTSTDGRIDLLSAALWKRLDANRDGKLSKAELLAAPRVLGALDRDEDELVSPSELFGVPASVPTQAGTQGPAHGAVGYLPFVSLRPGGPAAPLVAALLAAYDRDRDGRLTRREASIDADVFRRLDGDSDGKLDGKELAGWLSSPPDVSVIVPLRGGRAKAVEVLPGVDKGVTVRPMREGVWLLFGDHAVGVRRLTGGTGPAAPSAAPMFQALDRNEDGYLDSKEVQRPPFRHVAWLRLADRDRDGKISRKEFDAFLAFQKDAQGAATYLRIDSEGRSLHRLLDADGDGFLGARELSQSWARVSPWSERGATVVGAKLPRQFCVSLSHGAAPAGAPARVSAQGPLWFRKMDRNRDGDVSRNEWLGTKDQFNEIDTDSDGLISPEEAERADRKMRTER